MVDSQRPLVPMIGARLRHPLRLLSEQVARDVLAAGFEDIRPPHFTVFQHLDAEGSRLTTIAARASITKQSVAALVDELEAMGYIARFPDPDDKRARIIRRTDKGWALEVVARTSVGAFEDAWRARVSEEEWQAFTRVLNALAEGLLEPGSAETGRLGGDTEPALGMD